MQGKSPDTISCISQGKSLYTISYISQRKHFIQFLVFGKENYLPKAVSCIFKGKPLNTRKITPDNFSYVQRKLAKTILCFHQVNLSEENIKK